MSPMSIFTKKPAEVVLIEDFIRKSKEGEPDAIKAVVAAGAPIVDKLIPLLTVDKNHPDAVRRNAMHALARIRDPRAVDPLIALLEDTDPTIRAQAAGILGHLGDKRAVEPLIKKLSDGYGYAVCAAAARSLGRLHDKRALEPLIRMLNGGCTYESGCEAAAEALGELGDLQAAPVLVERLHDQDAAMRKLVAVALQRMGWKPPTPDAKASWLVAMQDWDGCVAMGADAVPQLNLAFNSPDFDIAWKATNAVNTINQHKHATV
jgi:HEAT repeat protein